MYTLELVKILKTLPEGSFDVIVKGRSLNGRKPIICASVPDGPIPKGWMPANESAIQHVPGSRRVRYIGE
jgi:hypothetical protein